MSALLLFSEIALVVLLLAGAALTLSARSATVRLLGLDMLSILLASFLLLMAYSRGSGHFLDAALAVALLGFVVTMRAAQHLEQDRDEP